MPSTAGMTATDMIADTLPTFDMTQIPLGRVGTPEEVNSAVYELPPTHPYLRGAGSLCVCLLSDFPQLAGHILVAHD